MSLSSARPAVIVLACGDRNFADRGAVYLALDSLPVVDVLVEGEAPGADTLAREWAEARGIPVLRFPADWSRYGRAAGPVRNRQMLVEGQPSVVVYFHHDLDASKGTKDMVAQARKANVKVIDGVTLAQSAARDDWEFLED